jgi:hypothetical protein
VTVALSAAAAGRLSRASLWALRLGAVGLLVLVGMLGDSVATPGLGPRTGSPPYDLAAHPPGWLVTALLAAGYAAGAGAVLLGLRRLARTDDDPGGRPGVLIAVGALAVLAMVLVPPVGSADHLSYLAYGRIAAAGDDPYQVDPIGWHGGRDPVAGAVQPPWQHTPSVYGPVATAAQALVAVGGHGSLRLTVWLWQLLCGLAFLVTGLVLDRTAGPDPRRRARVAVVWTLNPVLLGQLVLGAHLDVIAVALGVGALALAARDRLLTGALPAGLLLGAATGTKLPYGLFGLAALWGLRRLPRRVVAARVAVVGIAAVLVVVTGQLWAGPHAFDQLRRASRFTSLATPWRAVANLGDLLLGHGALAPVIAPLALLVGAALAVPLWRRLAVVRTDHPADVALLPATKLDTTPDVVRREAVLAALALGAAWAFTAPYALPWYDAMVWAPLALIGPSLLDRLALIRLTVLALAYLPGRVVGLAPTLESVTLGVRTYLAPVAVLAVLFGTALWSLRRVSAA